LGLIRNLSGFSSGFRVSEWWGLGFRLGARGEVVEQPDDEHHPANHVAELPPVERVRV